MLKQDWNMAEAPKFDRFLPHIHCLASCWSTFIFAGNSNSCDRQEVKKCKEENYYVHTEFSLWTNDNRAVMIAGESGKKEVKIRNYSKKNVNSVSIYKKFKQIDIEKFLWCDCDMSNSLIKLLGIYQFYFKNLIPEPTCHMICLPLQRLNSSI
jgi:hypothetical protein